jgi:exopolysaccharide biosynthesis predicted pyruvyltransferase EpsI
LAKWVQLALIPTHLLVASPQCGTLKKKTTKLILTRKDQNNQSKKSSEETAQRKTVWRQGGNAVTVQMESLAPDLSKN